MRRRRDREIGVRSQGLAGVRRLRAWLAEAPSEELRRRIERARAALTGLGWLLGAGGFFLGWAAASALLRIEVHEGRINIVLAVALLVMLPLGTLALAVGGLIASFGLRRVEQPSWLGDRLRGAGVGRLALALLGASVREDVEVVLGRVEAHARLYGRVQRGQLLLWSQLLGSGFALGALVGTLAFVVFTDLAFGWSTTLDVEARAVHHWVRLMASPWAGLWPEASPSLELVESTRFFRVAADDHLHWIDPILYGGWWPFLVMSIGCYALAPRILSTLLVAYWLQRETGRAMGLTPGVERLVARLDTPLVEGRADAVEAARGEPSAGLVSEVPIEQLLGDGPGRASLLIRWAGLLPGDALGRTLGLSEPDVADAGAPRSLEDDARVVARSARLEAGIAVCVRGDEPPLLDLLDFLAELRSGVGPERLVCVVLFGGDASTAAAWRRRLSTLGDPALRLARFDSEGARERGNGSRADG